MDGMGHIFGSGTVGLFLHPSARFIFWLTIWSTSLGDLIYKSKRLIFWAQAFWSIAKLTFGHCGEKNHGLFEASQGGIFRQCGQVFSKAFRSRSRRNVVWFAAGLLEYVGSAIRGKTRPFRMEHNNKRPTSSWTFGGNRNPIPRYRNGFCLNINW